MGGSISVAAPGTGGGGSGGGASVDVSDTPPSSPTAGSIWFDSSTGSLFVYITDTDSSQWVQPTAPVPDFSTFSSVQITGGAQSIDASTKSDTLNFTAGTNITMTIDEASNTLTINSTGGGGGGTPGACAIPIGLTVTVTVTKTSNPGYSNVQNAALVCTTNSAGTWSCPKPNNLVAGQNDYKISASSSAGSDSKSNITT